MKNLKESEKNFLTCAILIALVGIALVFLDQTTLGILSIIAAGVFVAIFFKMVITRKKEEKEEEKNKRSKEEIKEKLKIFITRYQAKEAKEQIQYYRKGKITEEERNILKEMEIRIDQLDFDEAEILMKRWEAME